MARSACCESFARLVGFQVSDAESPVRSPRAVLKGNGLFQAAARRPSPDPAGCKAHRVIAERTGVIRIDLNRFFKMPGQRRRSSFPGLRARPLGIERLDCQEPWRGRFRNAFEPAPGSIFQRLRDPFEPPCGRSAPEWGRLTHLLFSASHISSGFIISAIVTEAPSHLEMNFFPNREIAGSARFHDVVSRRKIIDGRLARHVRCIFRKFRSTLSQDPHPPESAELRSVG